MIEFMATLAYVGGFSAAVASTRSKGGGLIEQLMDGFIWPAKIVDLLVSDFIGAIRKKTDD